MFNVTFSNLRIKITDNNKDIIITTKVWIKLFTITYYLI